MNIGKPQFAVPIDVVYGFQNLNLNIRKARKRHRCPLILPGYEPRNPPSHSALARLPKGHFLLRLVELEMMDRERRATERRIIKLAKFPVIKSLETYNFLACPQFNKKLVMELARVRVDLHQAGERVGVGQLGNGQDSHRAGSGPGSLPTRFSGALHDRGGAGA